MKIGRENRSSAAAGQLLTKMIQACGLKREDVYILNVLKCRPPENRNPLPDEVTNCRGYFERQLAIIRPEVICCLGAVAAKSLLCTEQSHRQIARHSFTTIRAYPSSAPIIRLICCEIRRRRSMPGKI